jgi:shikimate 5-dehydrogenase
MKKTYDPTIFGVLCAGPCKADDWLARKLSEKVGESVLLPFSVETRHVKNVMLTMQLMDIVGLVIEDAHSEVILKHAKKIDRFARAAGRADLLLRRRASFTAYNSVAAACAAWCEQQGLRPRSAIVLGEHPFAKSVIGALTSLGCTVRKAGPKNIAACDIAVVGDGDVQGVRALAASMRKYPAGTAVIDLSNHFRASSRMKRLSLTQLQKDARLIRVGLLTSAAQDN